MHERHLPRRFLFVICRKPLKLMHLHGIKAAMAPTIFLLGSSNGIGRATAILFASEGAKVTITGRNGSDLLVRFQS